MYNAVSADGISFGGIEWVRLRDVVLKEQSSTTSRMPSLNINIIYNSKIHFNALSSSIDRQ